MNYELAKKLKEAGFPQEGNGGFSRVRHNLSEKEVEVLELYIPTLSELIEACGEDFGGVSKTNNEGGFLGKWMACTVSNKIPIPTGGSTPEEAVANLWLGLNKH